MEQLVNITRRHVIPGLFVLLVLCWGADAATDPTSPLSSSCTLDALPSCKPHDYVPKNVRRWKHPRSRLIAQSGIANHAIQDLLVTEGSPVIVGGKFAYGHPSKDLEDEPVLGFLDTSSGWVPLGEESTDDDGRVWFTVSPPLQSGVYNVKLEVEGDASVADAWLWVLPRGTHLSIFDIDGTLTTRDEEILKNVEADLFLPLLHRQYVPKAYPGAVLLTQAQAARGYVNVYLTGRPY
jgi:hypothetical protein